MPIFHLEVIDKEALDAKGDYCLWTRAGGFIVTAKDEQQARQIASDQELRATWWLDPTATKCNKVEDNNEPRIIMGDWPTG